MRYPALNDLISKAENKYSLVLATAKRAREIVDGDEPLVKIKIDNPVTIATNEIAEEMIHCVHKTAEPESLQHFEMVNESHSTLLKSGETEELPTIIE
ncbi:DNA-directed RNA polymerase subunit omega [Acetobacterium wieringae]|jgi:DNA-directed RNA polymerase subunit omega|uniref:DNA-directed RNA polymerase subunit omega n=1 Tax=Acetobacterium wieringae TaxID=52694 RepID=A0A1F2PI12_9FIRM|nr:MULTISPECIES: DNA-directed RNA polymerase subunit omega [Acetobacterium]MEA4804737.1 DNA-directed RNA polymerase subunit omega [Acetobacterium wieringae]OFV70695.1 DNA-directed RNA polymerase subunit omega [Acetobacterium wieringae]URN83020.1 DNA-directed RNA polymerase subunit omega [Acetobacterium wieringae]UYO61397.1 DNA-directed RNA polymerase subunit omega [Acetobacterium wieringae]VUZ28702.1 DNA-directed RNA polymerase subunit omega [Acetobacterium wieringae]